MIKTLEIKKVAAAIVAVAMIFGAVYALSTVKAYALTEAQIQSILSLLSSFGADTPTIGNVENSLRGLPTTGGSGSTTGGTGFTFTKNLSQGMTDSEVLQLQKFLNTMSDTQVSASGVGSAGNETSYFGPATKAAAVKFQNKYASEVLAPVGLSSGTGYWGASSRAKANALNAAGGSTGGTTGGGTTTPAPTGTGLSVAAASQPAASLAPDSAARVPFTKFTVTAGSDGAVNLDSVTIQRVGLGANASFSGVVLLDENGVQLGTSKTLNSNDQTTVGETVAIPAGQSRTFTVAGNMAADNSTRAGQVVGLNVIAVNTSAAVSGALPIVGTQHTINATLTIGSVTVATSSFDPNSAQSKEIGTTGVRVAGIQVTAGSAENVRIRNIRWNMTGSAGSSDIANVVTIVDGTAYPTVVSADGKFYTAQFGSGIVVAKGNSADIYVKLDIIGGSNRTVIFDIEKATDIYITGETFGYGITASAPTTGSAATTSSVFTTGTPFFDNATMSITAGSASTIQKSASVPAQNIAVNVPNQPLGAFETDIKGEAINVAGMSLTVASTTGSGTGLLTNVTIVDQNGSVIAGPIDATYTSALVQTLSFTDSITIPTGKSTYTLKGKVASGIGNGGTYIVTVTPSGWTSPTGNTTGDAVTISQSAFTLNTMTVRAAQLDITVAATPVAQNITKGAQGFTFANYQFDATQSGEDVRFSSMVGLLGGGSDGTEGAYNNLSACQLWDSATALNTGTNVVDPSAGTASSTSANTFTFDQTLVIPKGTIKTLTLKCNLLSSSHTASTYQWGIANTAANIAVTGVTSSTAVTENVTAANGQLMTVATVSVVASKDSSSPSYTIAAAGSTAVVGGVINFRSSNEAVTLQRVGLKLTNPAASSTPSDLVRVSLWDGNAEVGSAVFTGSNRYATATLSVPVTLPKDQDKKLTVKIDLAQIGTSLSGTQGRLVAVDIDTNGTNTEGVGQQSGTTVDASGSTAFDGVRVFKSYPTFAKLAVPQTSLVSGTTQDLYRFSVTANSAGDIGIYKFTVNIATSSTPANTSSTTVTNLKVSAYTDSGFSTPVSGFNPAGQLNDTTAGLISSGTTTVYMTASTQSVDYLQIPAGLTYYFRVTGTVTLTGSPTGGLVTTDVEGDNAYPALASLLDDAVAVDVASDTDDFIWSPNATTTSNLTHLDWINGYFIPGLPAGNMDSQSLSK